jgi:hypothetical protein
MIGILIPSSLVVALVGTHEVHASLGLISTFDLHKNLEAIGGVASPTFKG